MLVCFMQDVPFPCVNPFVFAERLHLSASKLYTLNVSLSPLWIIGVQPPLCSFLSSPGKGKTPLRRSKGAAICDQGKALVSQGTCEKSCQVTSEQIKADVKAATETCRRSAAKEKGCEMEGGAARQRADGGLVQSTGSSGAASSCRTRPITGPVSRVGAGTAPGHTQGFGRNADRNTCSPTADRSTGCGRTGGSTCHRSDLQAGDGPTARRGSGSSRNPPSGCASSGTPQERQRSREPAMAGLDCSQHNEGCQNFIPRRPLTRSCTTTSAESWEPEPGTNQ